MSRPAEEIGKSLARRAPRGWALTGAQHFRRLLGILATSLSTAEAEPATLMDEIDPRMAQALLPDFERVLGPDPCGRDADYLTVPQRQRMAHQRWTARGGQSIPYFVALAARLGVAVTVEEFWPSRSGVLRAGQRLKREGCQFVWRVNIPGLVTVTNFKAGVSRAGHRLGTFELSAIECEIRRLRPAHTTVIFSYGGS